MSERNRKYDSIKILGITIVLLSLLSYLQKSDIEVGGITIKRVNLLSDIQQSDKPKFVAAKVDTTAKTIVTKEGKVIPKTFIEIFNTDTSQSLAFFFDALSGSLKDQSTTRIAYFGDSQIEGDMLTQTLRLLLQRNFGGQGVGMVPITSTVAGFRNTITHSFSTNWKQYSFLKNSQEHPIGILGWTFIPQYQEEINGEDTIKKTTSWVSYKFSSKFSTAKSFNEIKLYYAANNSHAYVKYNKLDSSVTTKLDGTKKVNELLLTSNAQNSIKLSFNTKLPVDLYGVSFDNNKGVILDNYAFRGTSGLNLQTMPCSILQSFNEYLNYKLIVLHYGPNVAANTTQNFDFYEKGMVKVIRHLQKCFPQASILVIGMGDKSYNNRGVYETQTNIPLLVQAQKNAAKKCNVAFWNLYEYMGGYNSMGVWVDSLKLANKDYTHLNYKGTDKVARAMYSDIMFEFDEHKKNSKTVKK